MKIKQKLLITFIGLSILVSLVGFLAIQSLRHITVDIHQVRKSSIPELESSTDMALVFLKIRSLFKDYTQQTKEDYSGRLEAIKKDIKDHFTEFEKALELREKVTISGLELYEGKELQEENNEIAKIKYLDDQYRLYKKSVSEYIASGLNKMDIYKRENIERQIKTSDSILLGNLKLFEKETQEEITSETFEIENKARYSTNFMLVVAGLSFLFAIIAGLLITKSIVYPILKLKSAVQNVARGNMDIIQKTTKDEIGDLTVSFNKMTEELKKNKAKLEEYNKDLEEKVWERTGQLEENIQMLKQAEEKSIRYAEGLKNSNLELEQFAYVASHDLQEPLRTASNFASLLQKQYKGRWDDKADQYFSFILQSTERMRVLINHLLDYSRIGRKKEIELVDCNIILHETLADLSLVIKETKSEIKYFSLPVIKGYPTEIKQLFQNLIVNAIKFRKKHICPKIEISAQKDSGYWKFAVKDNGIGIEKKYSEKIFTIFQRLHNRKDYEGSGIGLAHCKKIVELHGGKIWIESEPNVGTTFFFTIARGNRKES